MQNFFVAGDYAGIGRVGIWLVDGTTFDSTRVYDLGVGGFSPLRRLRVWSATRGAGVGWNTSIFVTWDGTTWTRRAGASSNPQFWWTDVVPRDDGKYWLTQANGLAAPGAGVYEYDPATDAVTRIYAFPSGGAQSIAKVSEDEVWAFSSRGHTHKWNGTVWAEIADRVGDIPTTAVLDDGSVVSARSYYNPGAVYHKPVGTDTFSILCYFDVVNWAYAYQNWSMLGSSSSDLWIAGGASSAADRIFYFDGSGLAEVKLYVPTYQHYSIDRDSNDPNNLVVAANYANSPYTPAVRYSTDGGTSWTLLASSKFSGGSYTQGIAFIPSAAAAGGPRNSNVALGGGGRGCLITPAAF